MNDTTVNGNMDDRRSRIALVAMLMFSVVGIAIAADLANIYVASRTDPDFQSFCAVSDGINCTSVALSEYSTVFNTPVAVWAMAGYLFTAFLSAMAAFRRKTGFGAGFLFIFGCLFTLVSIWLIVVMTFLIHSICILCMAIDVINLAFMVMAIFAIHTTGRTIKQAVRDDFVDVFRHPARLAVLAATGIGILAAAAFVGPMLMNEATVTAAAPRDETVLSPRTGDASGQCSGDQAKSAVETQRGISPDGHPWIGSPSPKIEIHEFTDYECPFCRKAHMMVRQLVASNPDIRVFHRHLPLDNKCNSSIEQPFHKRACELSKISICAGEQGRFWEMNDFLFQHSQEIIGESLGTTKIAKRLELDMDRFQCCMNDESRFAIMKSDIDEGNRRELKGTPAFIINESVYYGKIPSEALVPRQMALPSD